MLSPAALEALAAARHDDPFGVLGMHECDGALVVRAVLPEATAVEVIDRASGRRVAKLVQRHPAGVFEAPIPRRRRRFEYRLRVTRGATVIEIDDPYRFPPVLGEFDVWLLAEGRHLRLYEKLGAHAAISLGVDGHAFAVWAPNASAVAVVGDFNQWDGRRHPMRRRRECGVWEIFLPGVMPGVSG